MTALIDEINLCLYKTLSAQVGGKLWRMNACSLIAPHVLAESSTCAKRARLACKDQKTNETNQTFNPL